MRAALLLVLLLATPMALATTTTKSYSGWGEFAVACAGVGGACFSVPSGSKTVDALIEDATGFPMSFYVEFRGVANANLGGTFGCGSQAEVAIPTGAVSSIVYVGGPVTAARNCEIGTVGIATKGTITLAFR